MRLVHPVDPALRILVEDVDDAQIAAEVERRVRDLFRGRQTGDQWTIAVAAADIRGRWDLAVKGPTGTHLLSFAAPPQQLPEFVTRYLERTLEQFRI